MPEGTPVAVFFLIGILIVATGPFPSVTKAALLLAAIFLINLDDQVLFWFGMRPEGHLHAAWFVSLLLLESARLATWSRWRLFAGAFGLSWASCVHYYALPAMGGLLVYLVWAMRSLPRKEVLGRVQAMIAGALLFVAPFVFLYLIPNWSLIASSIVGHQSSGGTALSMQTHFEMYRYWAGDQLLPALVRWACAARVPVMVWSSAILIAVPATRGIGLAALPLQLGIFFFASHKQNHYLVHELAMFSVAAAVGLGELIALAGRVRMAGVRLRAAVAPALTAICCLYLLKDPVNFHRIYFSDSSEEIVGRFRLGELAKRVIEGEFEDAVGAKAIGFSHGEFGFVIQSFNDPAGKQF
jgi:hypothetical protein